MTTTLAIEGMTVTLPELLDTMASGDEVILTRNHQPVAKLVSEAIEKRLPRQPGNCIGMMRIVAENDDHLEG